MYIGDSTFSPEAEEAAFRKLHNLSVAISQLRAQGNTYGVQQLLPYFRDAIAAYRAAGATDPVYLNEMEAMLLSLGNTVEAVGGAAASAITSGTRTVLLAGAMVLVGLYLWKKR